MSAVKTGAPTVVRPGPVFWDSLTRAHQDALLSDPKLGKKRSYQRGEAITQWGEPASAAVIVHEGWIKSTLATSRGTSTLLRLYGPGDLLGTETRVGARYGESTFALTRCRVTALTPEEFANQLASSPEMAWTLNQIEVQRRSSVEQRLALASYSGSERVAQTLVGLANTFGYQDQATSPITFPIPLSQDELSTLAGTHRNTTVRALERFRRKKMISTHRCRIQILDLLSLKECMG